MIITLCILTYILVGIISGRIMFVRILGDTPRHNTAGRVTRAYDDAIWCMALSILFWPITLTFGLLLSPTPHEKRLKKLEEQKEFEVRYKQLEKDVLKFGRNL